MKTNIKLIAILIAFSTQSFAQFNITGKVLDQETMTPIMDVHIGSTDRSSGSTSSVDGSFKLVVKERKSIIEFTSIGYKKHIISVNNKLKNVDLGIVLMQAQPYSLDEISINAGVSTQDELPVSISNISARNIEQKLGDRPLPLVLQNTPGVFSVRDGGGSGDSKLSIRGFKQENVSLLLNGIPINGEENGLVYWSNWLGLSNAAAEIQIQKGAGVANASIYAIGGTVNIITKNAQKQRSGSVSFGATSYGNISTNIALNSGLMSNGWNTSLLLSLGSGPGYIDATYVSSFSYFFSAIKKINEQHEISITLLGAPQKHGQRTLKLSNEEIKTNGIFFNKDWGGYNGNIKNASENFYHKPFLTINHEYKINDKNLLSTSAYASIGYGGGRWSESFNYAPSIFSYRNNSEQIDWNSIYENNATNEDTYTLENGEIVTGYSQNVQTNFLASHIQAGIMSNFEHTINDNLRFLSGLHYRYFNSFVREQIDNLLGGEFFIEDYSWSLAGVSGRNQIKTVGDIIKVDNNSIINFGSIWGQLIYNTNRINTFASISLNNNWYKRIDRFNYIENQESELVNKNGFDIRAGFLYKLNEFHDIYFSSSYISKAPYFKYVFGNFTNVVVKDLKNEIAQTLEIGYKFNKRNIHANISGYITQRKNVSMLTNEYVQLEDNSQTRAMINGLNSLNKGIELEFKMDLNRNLSYGTWASFGDFRWQNNVNASLYNDNNIIVDTVNVYTKGLYIGGTAQNQIGVFADFVLLKTLYFKTEYQYFNNLYADFDPTSRNNPTDVSQSYQIPDYGVFNAYLSVPFTIEKLYGRIQVNAYNILNSKHIVIGEDGADHSLESFRGFWAFGRNLTFSLTINF